MTFSSDTMINYQLFKKLKLIRIGKLNHLSITLTYLIQNDVILMFNIIYKIYIIYIRYVIVFAYLKTLFASAYVDSDFC